MSPQDIVKVILIALGSIGVIVLIGSVVEAILEEQKDDRHP